MACLVKGRVSRTQQPASELLSSGKKTKLKVQAQEAEGTISIELEPRAGKDIELHYQISYVLERGGTATTKPGRYLLGVDRSATANPAGGARILRWGDVIDPDGDCKVVLENGGMKLEVSGSLHDMNAEIGKLNALRVVQDVEGDFVVQVRVRGEFGPAGPGTRGCASV